MRIKIKNIIYTIDPTGTQLEIETKTTPKKYTLEQIKSKDRVRCLFEYASEVIMLMKKKQCDYEFVLHGVVFWMERGITNCYYARIRDKE